jgi:hypothetical protein
MPFEGSFRRGKALNPPPLPPEVVTWTPRAFTLPVSPQAADWGRFLLGLGCGLILIGVLSLLLGAM